MRLNKITALIPMRHHSQRVLHKNYRLIAGVPLYYHILRQLLKCPQIGQVVVDTDSPIIKRGILKDFPDVKVIDRPRYLCSDKISMNDILIFDTSQLQGRFFLQTHSTNPLLLSGTISSAIKIFEKNYPIYDSLFSVTKLQTRLWNSNKKPMNHNPDILIQTQDLPPVYEENSCMYIFSKRILQKKKNRIGYNPYLFSIDPIEAVDIDEEYDFKMAEVLLEMKKAKR